MPTGATFTGNATHFDGLGQPTGGCGVPEAQVEGPDFVALNVQQTPGNYEGFLPRPIAAGSVASIGAFANGRNCGRFLRVTLGDDCRGMNDGAQNQAFCRPIGGITWVADNFNGATLDLVVADSCGDGNAWCRDDPYHLDIATAALDHFQKDGRPVGPLLPDHFGNRRITWQFVKAPGYSGDLKFGLAQNASRYWLPVVITHLENGLHSVEVRTSNGWVKATMLSDLGQVYLLPQDATRPYQLRLFDADDQPVQRGRIYQFDLPPACGDSCDAIYTAVAYQTVGP